MSGRFWVFRCPECGQWSVKEIRVDVQKVSFNCKICRGNRKIKSSRREGLNIDFKGPFNLPRDATYTCQLLNDRRRMKS